MLWIHIGNDGVLDCKVNVGNKVRQGDGFDVFVSTENSGIATYEVEGIGYVKPGSDEVSNLNVTVKKSSQTFYLGSPSQANAFFKNGVEYEGYLGSIPSDATTFYANGGHIQLLICISKDGGITQHAENATVFVEPTYGKHYMGISCNDYDYLMHLLGEHEKYISNKLDKVSTDPQSVASAVKFNGRVDAANVNGGSPVVVKGGDVGVFARAFVTGDKGTVGFVPEPFYDNYASFYWSKEGNAVQAWLEEKAGSKTPLALRSDVEKEAIARKAADAGLQGQIDTINQSQNFVATVATHADLLSYDKSGLKDGDCILVLKDETHNNSPYVYKYVASTSSFAAVGEVGDSYTKAQSDEKYVKRLGGDDPFAGKAVYTHENEYDTYRRFSSNANPNELVQRDDSAQINLPNQASAEPGSEQAISRRYLEAKAILKGVSNVLSADTVLSFAKPAGGLQFVVGNQGLRFLEGSRQKYGLDSQGVFYATDSASKTATWEDIVDGALNSRLIASYEKAESAGTVAHDVKLNAQDGIRNSYVFTVDSDIGFGASIYDPDGGGFDLWRDTDSGQTYLSVVGGSASEPTEAIVGFTKSGDGLAFKIESRQRDFSLYSGKDMIIGSDGEMTLRTNDSPIRFEASGYDFSGASHVDFSGKALTLNGKQWGIFPVSFDHSQAGYVLASLMYYEPNNRYFYIKGLWLANESDGGVYATKKTSGLFYLADGASALESDGTVFLSGTDIDTFKAEFTAINDPKDQAGLINLMIGNGTGSVGMAKEEGKTVNMSGKNANAVAYDASLGNPMSVDASGSHSSIWGGASRAEGKRSFAQGTNTLAKGSYSHAEGDNAVAYGVETHAEGYATLAIGKGSHAEGYQTQTKTTKYAVPSGSTGGSGGSAIGGGVSSWNPEEHRGEFSHAEGTGTIASGYASHAEGGSSVADGVVSHAEGEGTLASGRAAKSFGAKTTASGDYSVAGGFGSNATGKASLAMGDGNSVSGSGSASFGNGNTVAGSNSFAVGQGNMVYGFNDANGGAAMGNHLASYNGCVVVGRYNEKEDTSQTTSRRNVFEVGAGTASTDKNALWVDSAGKAYVSDDPTQPRGVASKKYVDDRSYVDNSRTNGGWHYYGNIVEKSFTATPNEVKPGSSGTVGTANGYVSINTFKKALGNTVQYKTVVDVTFRTAAFDLKPIAVQAALVTYGTKWFMPRMGLLTSDINDAKFTKMMQVLYHDRANVGISWDETSVFRDMTVSTGSLNSNGMVLAQGYFGDTGIVPMAIIVELDTDNKNSDISVTGAHYKITFYHPNSIL